MEEMPKVESIFRKQNGNIEVIVLRFPNGDQEVYSVGLMGGSIQTNKLQNEEVVKNSWMK